MCGYGFIHVYSGVRAYLCECVYWPSGQSIRQRPGRSGFNPGRVIPRTQKWYLMLPCLTRRIIKCGTRVKWCNQEKGVAPFSTTRRSSN